VTCLHAAPHASASPLETLRSVGNYTRVLRFLKKYKKMYGNRVMEAATFVSSANIAGSTNADNISHVNTMSLELKEHTTHWVRAFW
jgi:hypothetical protein